MNKKLITLVIFLIGSFLVPVNYAYAAKGGAGPQKFKISLGGYSLFRFDSSISVTEPNLGAGIAIDPGDALGIDGEQSVVRLDGRYRFNDKHSLTFSWYKLSSVASKSIEDELTWVDKDGNEIVIPVGASVATDFIFDILKVGYLWSFYQTDKVELAVGGGLHFTKIKLALQAETVASGLFETEDVGVTVPLPVLSFGLKYNVTQRISWYIKSEVFAIKFDTWEGNYTDNTLGFEYRIWKHIGLGVGLGGNALGITQDAEKYTLGYDNQISGVMFFISGYY